MANGNGNGHSSAGRIGVFGTGGGLAGAFMILPFLSPTEREAIFGYLDSHSDPLLVIIVFLGLWLAYKVSQHDANDKKVQYEVNSIKDDMSELKKDVKKLDEKLDGLAEKVVSKDDLKFILELSKK